ncbi:hypothetical protein PUN28_018165 [Cardiocondyla obscurior]|uniref:Uncharacterized protein n=1 Tax=Cardiocondyla obscurior TaxID=286306 RepID=A0AAW2EIV5_9HYME
MISSRCENGHGTWKVEVSAKIISYISYAKYNSVIIFQSLSQTFLYLVPVTVNKLFSFFVPYFSFSSFFFFIRVVGKFTRNGPPISNLFSTSRASPTLDLRAIKRAAIVDGAVFAPPANFARERGVCPRSFSFLLGS